MKDLYGVSIWMDIMSDELSHLEKRTLLALDEHGGAASPSELTESGEFQQESQVMNAVSWLNSKELVEVDEKVTYYYSLAKKSVGDKDLPERTALKYLKKVGGKCSIQELSEGSGLDGKKTGIAVGWLRKKKWADTVKEGGETVLEMTSKGKKALREKGKDEELIRKLSKEGELPLEELDEYAVKKLKSRKELLDEEQRISRTVILTDEGKKVVDKGIELKPQISQLTPDIIRTGAWKEAEIRPYDIQAFAPTAYGGKRHPMKREIEVVRRVFLDMGFTEINYDFIQSAFWNFDALFSPQDHPARDLQDTFYLSRPATVDIDEEVAERVMAMHEDGGDTRSSGWGYRWSKEEAQRAVLRTHTTVATLRHLSENPEPPVKAFGLDWNFRSEKSDATHLSQFIQIEGVVMEEGANLNMLIGLMKEFYRKMGFDDVKVRPSYFPFTEPSLEVYAKYKGDYLEMGGAGIFREEVTRPHGIDCPVLAWGLGLERLVMLRLGIDDIRDCYTDDLTFLREYPLL